MVNELGKIVGIGTCKGSNYVHSISIAPLSIIKYEPAKLISN